MSREGTADRRPRSWRRWLIFGLGLIVVATALIGAGLYGYLRASLPQLSGTIETAGLTAEVTIDRDVDGVVTIVAEDQADLAHALGFVHAQERFFQMDLLRRAGAAELAALLGPSIIGVDQVRRVHRFRARARKAVEALSPGERAVLTAYASGVNAGLEALGAPPFEYALLQVSPKPWRLEDTFCVSYAMFFTLQDSSGQDELRRSAIERALEPDLAALALSPGTKWDAPLDDSGLALPAYPSRGSTRTSSPTPSRSDPPSAPIPGSNNWAIAGRLSTHGGAIVADDMHLTLRMPNIWYRARLRLTAEDGYDATGVTLAGTPALVAGSNGYVAWGFTNAYIDTSDVVVVEPGPTPDTYLTPDGPQPFERFDETIEARGGAAETMNIVETRWGPIIGRDFDGRQVALRWIAHDPESNDFGLLKLMRARTLEEAVTAAHHAGMPNQNVMIAAADGRIGWTLSGRIPRRPPGCDGLRPSSWARSGCTWQGYVESAEVPKVVDPKSGRLWTANNRILGPKQRGPTRYPNAALGARARQIRDRLRAESRFSERDLLAIQLDDRALFLKPWRTLMQGALSANDHPALAKAVEDWGGRASPGSVGYRAVREFRDAVLTRVVDPVLQPARALIDQAENVRVRRMRPRNIEHLAWTLLQKPPPPHLVSVLGLPAETSSWAPLLRAAVQDVLASIDERADGRVGGFTWGERNRLQIRHPLSKAVPALGWWLDPPSVPAAGDRDMPRVQSPTEGASERFVVSPGKEDQGIFHMPAGQASHPLSPYLHAGHEAWVRGEPTPFLPGATRWTLRLQPTGT